MADLMYTDINISAANSYSQFMTLAFWGCT